MVIGGFIMVGTAFSKKNYKICSCMPISKENQGGNYSKGETIQGRKLVYKRIQKGETIQRRKEIKDGKLFKEIRYIKFGTSRGAFAYGYMEKCPCNVLGPPLEVNYMIDNEQYKAFTTVMIVTPHVLRDRGVPDQCCLCKFEQGHLVCQSR